MRPDVLPWNCNKKKREVSQAEGFPGFSRAGAQNLAISGQVILLFLTLLILNAVSCKPLSLN